MAKLLRHTLRTIFVFVSSVTIAGLIASSAHATGNGPSGAIGYQLERQELIYTGRIGSDFDTVVVAALSAHPEARALVISSLGGNLTPALQAAKQLNSRGIAVRAAGPCASACAMLWAAAENRQVEKGATIGLHSSRPAQAMPSAVAKVLGGFVSEQKTQVLAQAGFPPRVIDKAMATPASKMYWLKANDLVRLGVDCDVVNTNLSI